MCCRLIVGLTKKDERGSMTIKNPYELLDAERTRRIEELVAMENPNGLEYEIAVLRQLAKEALDNGQTAFVADCMTRIARINASIETAKYKRGELLCKSAMLLTAQRLIETLTAAVAGRFDGWELTMDKVRQEALTVVSQAQNPDLDRIPLD
jgi:hypothetical protein